MQLKKSPTHPAKKLVLAICGLLVLLYPILLYFSLQSFEPRSVSLILLLIAAARLWLVDPREDTKFAKTRPILFIMTGSLLLSLALNDSTFLLINPCLTFVALSVFFFSTFFFPPNFAERMARVDFPDGVPPAARNYCALVTVAWGLFFVVSALVSLFTALYAELYLWTLFNGVFIWIFMGLMFGVEYLIRVFLEPVFKESQRKVDEGIL